MDATPAPAPLAADRLGLRGASLVALLGLESLVLSVLVDLPAVGPARAATDFLRVLFPVAVAAVGAGVVLLRARGPGAAPAPAALPGWRPVPIGLHALGFGVTLAWALRMLAPGAPPPGAGAFSGWVACAAVTALLGVAAAFPLRWLLRQLADGWRAQALALGLGGLAFVAAGLAERLWGVLSEGTLRLAAGLLAAAGGDVHVSLGDRVIGVPGFEVVIAPECSGAEGVGLLLIFLVLWVALARDRLRLGRALLLLPAGVAAAFAANAVRVAALVALGGAGHPDLAQGGFHSRLGWFLFTALALGGVAAAEHLPWIRRPAAGPRSPAQRSGIPGVERIVPLLAALATALATGLFAWGGVDLLYGARIAAAGLALVAIRRRLPSLRPAAPVASAAAGVVLAGIWIAGVGGGRAPLPDGLLALAPPGRAAWIGVRALGGIAVVPLVEELAFRGFLLPWLADPPGAPGAGTRRFPWLALAASSLAFAALHAQLALGAVAGLAFGGLRLWRGRVGDALVAHAACNAVLAAAVLGCDRWALWS